MSHEQTEKPEDELIEKLKAMYGRWKEQYPDGDIDLLEKQLMAGSKLPVKQMEDEGEEVEEVEEPSEVEGETEEVETEDDGAITPENIRKIVMEIATEVLNEHLDEVTKRIAGHEDAIGALTETLEALAEGEGE